MGGTRARWKDEQTNEICPWQKRWSMTSNQIHLLNFELIVQASFAGTATSSPKLIGHWRQSVADLHVDVEQSMRVLDLMAELINPLDNSPCCKLHLNIDIFTSGSGSRPCLSEKEVAGKPSQTKQLRIHPSIKESDNQSVVYYVSVFADNLPYQSASKSCDPYVRITMTGKEGRARSTTVRDKIYNVQWSQTIRIKTDSGTRQAKVELFNDTSIVGDGNDVQIGETTVYEINPDETTWHHFYGGAYDAPNPDEALRMAKGPSRQASTYRGSLAVSFGMRPEVPRTFFKECRASYTKATLSVRIHRGLYFEKYAGKNVKVVLQVAGCSLPVSQRRSTDRMSGFGKNRSLLSFPATVDKFGVMRLTVSDEDHATLMGGTEEGDIAWVERRTPRAYQLKWPQGVHHADIYIIEEGNEDLPPQCFGRIRLTERRSEHAAPKWKQMRWDTSVVALRGGQVQDNMAGFLLISALMTPKSAPVQVGVENIGMETTAQEVFEAFVKAIPMPEQTASADDTTPRRDRMVSGEEDAAAKAAANARLGPVSGVKLVQVAPNAEEKDAEQKKTQHAIVMLRSDDHWISLGKGRKTLTIGDKQVTMQKLSADDALEFEKGKEVDQDPPEEEDDDAKGGGWFTCGAGDSDEEHEKDEDEEEDEVGDDEEEEEEAPVGGGFCGGAQAVGDEMLIGKDVYMDPNVPKEETAVSHRKAADFLPRGAKPSSALCRPCVDEQVLNKGSPGETVLYAWALKYQTYYCHVDMIAARCLPSCDDDGLATPCYLIRSEQSCGGNWTAANQSLNPTYNERLVIGPITVTPEAVAGGSATKPHKISLPPVVLYMLDADTAMGKSVRSWETLGTAVIKGPPLMESTDGVLDLDTNHKAQWYGLDSKGSVGFDPNQPNGTILAWRRRARVLMAVAYSEGATELKVGRSRILGGTDPTKSNEAMFRINIDLLGLRSLSEDANFPKMLRISPFWPGGKKDGAAKLANYDFKEFGLVVQSEINLSCHAISDGAEFESIEKLVKPYFLFQKDASAERVPGTDPDVMVVSKQDILGWRLQLPVFKAPIIGYLQAKHAGPDSDCPQPDDGQGEGKIHELKHIMKDFVMMPDFVIELVDRYTGSSHGTLSEPLPISGIHSLGPESADIIRKFERTGKCVREYIPSGQARKVARMGLKKGDLVFVTDHEGAWMMGHKVSKFAGMEGAAGDVPAESGWFPGWAIEIEDGKSWTEKSAREYDAIKEKVKLDKWIKKGGQIQGKNLTPMTDAYDIFVDVFATKTGYLRWGTGFMMGRKLKDQHLLTIAENEHLPPEDQNDDDDDDNDDGPEWACCCHFGSFCCAMTLVGGLMGLVGSKLVEQGIQIADEGHEFSQKESSMIMGGSFGGWVLVSCLIYILIWCCCTAFHFSKNKKAALAKKIQLAYSDGKDEVSQYFNPTDRDQSAFNVPFDDQVMPTLWCASRTSASPDVLENDFDSDVAAWAAKRWADNREPNKMPKGTTLFPPVVAGAKGKNLARLKTKELKAVCEQNNLRCMSHLHKPEPLGSMMPGGAAPPGAVQKDPMEDNLHTFVRDVGHVIKPCNRDSKFLARLRMGTPEGLLQDKIFNVEATRFFLKMKKESVNARGGGSDDEKKTLIAESSEKADYEKALTALEVLLATEQERTSNFLNIKFLKAGVITWVSPEAQYMWNKPGEIIFIVRLEDGTTEVPVFVPGFDLRFSFESCWRPVKTLVGAAKDITLHINSQSQEPEEKGAKTPKGKKGEGKKGEPEPETKPDGYSRPIYVTKSAFVCRIKKDDSVSFDRQQTRNWWRTALEPVFPELQLMPEPQHENDLLLLKSYFCGRFMNLSSKLTVRGDTKGIARMKGHVSVTQVDELGDPNEKPKNNIRPIENLWIEQSVRISLVILTARELRLPSTGTYQVYCKAQILGGDDPQDCSETMQEVVVDPGKLGAANFYWPCQMFTRIPKGSMLRLEIWSKGGVLAMGMDELIGYCEVDLEDRWMAMQQIKMRSTSCGYYIQNTTSPWHKAKCGSMDCPNVVYKKLFNNETGPEVERVWEDEDDLTETTVIKDLDEIATLEADRAHKRDYPETFKPRMLPLPNSPIETWRMVNEDPDTQEETKVGNLRFFMDIMPEGEQGMDVSIVSDKKMFDIRIKVIDIMGINVFTDFGDRNDVVIKGVLAYTDPMTGRPQLIIKETDTHQYARSYANFQHMWVFSVPAPVAMIELRFFVKNENRFTADESLFRSKVLPLDIPLILAYERDGDGKEALPEYAQDIVFDAPAPKILKGMESALRNSVFARLKKCGKRPKLPPFTPATLKISVRVLPDSLAKIEKAEDGPLTQNIKGRVQFPQILMNPTEAANVLIGQRNLGTVRMALVYTGVILVLFFTLAVMYLVGQNLAPLMK